MDKKRLQLIKLNNKRIKTKIYGSYEFDQKIIGRVLTKSNLNKKGSPDYDVHFGTKDDVLHKLLVDKFDFKIESAVFSCYGEEVGIEFSISAQGHVQIRVNKLHQYANKFLCQNDSEKDKENLVILFDFMDKKIEFEYEEKLENIESVSIVDLKENEIKEIYNECFGGDSIINESDKAYIFENEVKKRNPTLQQKYRKRLEKEFGNKCAFCKIDDSRFLIASHIVAVKDCIDALGNPKIKEMFDSNNGFLLCPNHDSLFDKGYITVNEIGKIKCSTKLSESTKEFFGLNIEIEIETKHLTNERQGYLKNHKFE